MQKSQDGRAVCSTSNAKPSHHSRACTTACMSGKKRKNYAGSEDPLPTLIKEKKSHFGNGYRKTAPPKGKNRSVGIRRVASLTGKNRLLMTVDNSTGKCASGMDKFGSVIA